MEFPEDLAGWACVRLRGLARGQVVTFRYDERVDSGFKPAVRTFGDRGVRDPMPDPQNRRIDCYYHDPSASAGVLPGGGFQTDRFVSAGAAEETYGPRFGYHGLLSRRQRAPVPARPSDVVACDIHTAFETTGSFASSDDTLNALMAMTDPLT